MLIGAINKQIEEVFIRLLENKRIAKLLYYTKNCDIDIDELPDVKNPVGTLKHNVSKHRRLEKLQKESEAGIFINTYYKGEWKEYGGRHDKSLAHVIEIGVITNVDNDDTVNGSRTYCLCDLIIQEIDGWNVNGLGKIHFNAMERVRDLSPELIGYSLKFTIFSLKSEP